MISGQSPYNFGGAPQWSFVAASSSKLNTIALPAQAAAGDIAYFFDMVLGAEPASFAAPADWTASKIIDAGLTTSAAGLVIARRLLTADDLPGGAKDGVVTTGISSLSTGRARILLVFRPGKASPSITEGAWGGQVTAGNPSAQTVAAAGQTPPVLVLGCAGGGSGGGFNFSTALPAFDGQFALDGSNVYLRVGYKIYNTSPANHTIDVSDVGGYTFLATDWVTLS